MVPSKNLTFAPKSLHRSPNEVIPFLDYSPDGTKLAVMIDPDNESPRILLLDAITGEILQDYPGAVSVAYFSPSNCMSLPLANDITPANNHIQETPMRTQSAVPEVVMEEVLHTEPAAEIDEHEASQILPQTACPGRP